MENLEVSLTAKNTAYEGENNADSVKLTLPEYLRGFDSYIIRRRDGYGEVTDSERLHEIDGAVTMPLTADILRGNKLQLQLIAFEGDTVSKSEPVTLEVGLSLRLTAEKQEEYRDLTAEMVEALNRADNLKDGFSPTVSVTKTTDGHEVSITDKDGEKKFSVPNGKDGKTPQKNVDYFDGKDGKSFTYDMFTKEQLEALKGKDGKSAYQYAVDGGYMGTEEEFKSLLAEEHLKKNIGAENGHKILYVDLDGTIVPIPIPVDPTLTQELQAAEAKSTGEAFRKRDQILNEYVRQFSQEVIPSLVPKNQGAENVGKVMSIDEDGYAVPKSLADPVEKFYYKEYTQVAAISEEIPDLLNYDDISVIVVTEANDGETFTRINSCSLLRNSKRSEIAYFWQETISKSYPVLSMIMSPTYGVFEAQGVMVQNRLALYSGGGFGAWKSAVYFNKAVDSDKKDGIDIRFHADIKSVKIYLYGRKIK